MVLGRNAQKRVDGPLRKYVYGVSRTLSDRIQNLASTIAQKSEFDIVDLKSARNAIADARRGLRGLLALTAGAVLSHWGASR